MSVSKSKSFEARDVRVAKWGNSLAVRLPQAFAAGLGGNGSTVRLTMSASQRTARISAASGFGETEQAAIAHAPVEAVIGKWGNSLGVRLSVELVRELGLKEGDMVTLTTDGETLAVARQRTRAEALEALASLRGMIPADFKLDREEANSRIPSDED